MQSFWHIVGCISLQHFPPWSLLLGAELLTRTGLAGAGLVVLALVVLLWQRPGRAGEEPAPS